MEKELLQLLADQAGCIFLSDLHDPDKIELLAEILPALPAERYTLWDWNDAVEYITGRTKQFGSPAAAKAFLRRFCSSGLPFAKALDS